MHCPICHYPDTKVINSRIASDGLSVRRRRECLKCSFRFSTIEEIEILNLTVVKRNGYRENYCRDKVIQGIKKSLEKRAVTNDNLKKLISRIERDIQLKKSNEIKSSQIGKIVMKHLKKLDQVAYIRFASVYQDFKDVNSFKRELNRLLKKKKKKKVKQK